MKKKNLLVKVITLLLVSVLVLGLATGCGQAYEAPAAEAPVEAVEEVEAAAEPEPEDFVEVEEEAWEMDLDESEDLALAEQVVVEVAQPRETTQEQISEGNMGPIPILLASETGRQLVYTTDIIIETTQFMEGQRILLNEVTRLNGHSERTIVNGRHIITPYVERDADFFLRLPPENLIELIIFIEDHFQLVYLHKEMIDLTIVYERNLSHLDDLREREERLLENLEEEDSPRDPEDIEQELQDIRQDIRNIQETTIQIDDHVAYSELTIRLYEVILPEEAPPEEPEEPQPFGERLQETTGDSMYRLLTMLQGFLIFLIAALPVLLPLTLIGLVAFYVYKKTNQKKRNAPPVVGYPVPPTVQPQAQPPMQAQPPVKSPAPPTESNGGKTT